MCTLLLGVTACGKKSDNSGATLSADDPNTFTDQQTGETFNVSSDPHPADCDNNKQESPGFTKVDGCSEAVMQAQRVETEGICFVFETVTPTYRHEPPSSGPQFQSPFFFDYERDSKLKRGRIVRSLAHGNVVIAYHCPGDSCAGELDQIYNIMTGSDVAGNPVIMTDDPLLNTPGNRFAALAWNYVYSFDTVDVAALKCFIRQHVSWGLTGYVNGGTQ